MRSNCGGAASSVQPLLDGVADEDLRRLAEPVGHHEPLAADVLDLRGEDATLQRHEARDLVVLAVVALDDDLAIERVRHDRGGLGRNRLGEALADEALVAVDGDRPGLEGRVGRVHEANRAEREVVVAAIALGVV